MVNDVLTFETEVSQKKDGTQNMKAKNVTGRGGLWAKGLGRRWHGRHAHPQGRLRPGALQRRYGSGVLRGTLFWRSEAPELDYPTGGSGWEIPRGHEGQFLQASLEGCRGRHANTC